MGNIIELQGLKRTFKGNVRAVDDISLNVREGEFVTVLGPSGCGKTTTLRIIGGFEYPDEGRVLLDGDDVTDLPPYHRPVNLVFQDFALFPHMSVAQNVGYGLRIAGMQKSEIDGRVTDILRMVDLLEKAGNRPAELSNGQKQRVALARALIRRPKVLLLDEPLSALDLKLREAMQVELKHLHKKIGITFIMVTHDQTEALVMSDRIVVMNEGKIVQDGTPAELYDQPASPYVANFIGSSNLVPGEVAEVGNGAIVGRVGEHRITAASNGLAVEVGAAITLCIRPEKIQLLEPGTAAPEGFATLRGVVNETFFHGNAVRVAVDLGEGVTFMVDQRLVATLGQSDLPDAGTAVDLAFDPANVIVFRGGQALMNHIQRRRLTMFGVVSGPLLWMIAFLFVPYAVMFTYSFYSRQFPAIIPDLQFGNYISLVTDPQYYQVLLRTLKIASLVSIAALAIAYPLTYYLVFVSRTRFPWTQNWLNRSVQGGPEHDRQF